MSSATATDHLQHFFRGWSQILLYLCKSVVCILIALVTKSEFVEKYEIKHVLYIPVASEEIVKYVSRCLTKRLKSNYRMTFGHIVYSPNRISFIISDIQVACTNYRLKTPYHAVWGKWLQRKFCNSSFIFYFGNRK